MRWECAGSRRDLLLDSEAASRRKQWDQEQEPSYEHAESDRQVVPGRVRTQSSESAAVIAGCAGIGVQNLAQSVWAGIGQVGDGRAGWIPVAIFRKGDHGSDTTKHQNAEGRGNDGQHGHLDLFLFYLF